MVARAVVASSVVTLILGCAAGGTTPPEPSVVHLTHDELKALLAATRTVRIATQGAKVIGIYSPDGVARVDWGSGGATGTWRLQGNKFCSKYPGVRRGYETCYLLEKTG